jgi:hypothetical protein
MALDLVPTDGDPAEIVGLFLGPVTTSLLITVPQDSPIVLSPVCQEHAIEPFSPPPRDKCQCQWTRIH